MTKKPHPTTGTADAAKTNNKQKPPNTLLSSQTTHPPTAQQAHGSGPCAASADGQGVHRSGYPSGMPSRSADWPRRDDLPKLRDRKRGVKQPARRHVSARARSINALDPGNIPLAAAQHQPASMQEVGWLGYPVLVVDLGVVDRNAALGDRASCGAFALR